MEGYIAEIRMFAADFAPRNWSYCNGALMSIAQNSALFSLLGTTYGGDGRVTFGLPDFRGRTAVGTGQGPGLTAVSLGELSGTNAVTLIQSEMPSHTHTGGNTNLNPNCFNGPGEETNPTSGFLATVGANIYASTHNTAMGLVTTPVTIAAAGGNQPHDNTQPSLGINYIICLYGIFPSRN
jgi:microcystin-dependent protein